MSSLFFTSSKLYHTICRRNQKKDGKKDYPTIFFFKRDGNSRNTITFAGKNLCHFALSLFFFSFSG